MKFRNWRKIVRLERQPPLEQAERGEVIESALVGSEEIPFGAKALELEPAVDGVWNARTTTPLHTPAGSRGSSPRLGPSKRWHKSKRGSSVSSVSRLDIDEPARVVNQPGRCCHLRPLHVIDHVIQSHSQRQPSHWMAKRRCRPPGERRPTLSLSAMPVLP
jgi:hypothetical protein